MSVIFDTTQYFSRGTQLTGAADSKKGLLSVWLKRQGTGTTQRLVNFAAALGGLNAGFNGSDVFIIQGFDNGGTKVLDISTTAITSTSLWYHIMASWDLSSTTTHLYVNGTSDNTETTATDTAIDFTTGTWGVGAIGAGGTSGMNAKVYDLFFAPGQYMDLSDATERRKLVSSDGVTISASLNTYHPATIPSGVKPVGYGHDLTLPTGTAPALFFSGQWRDNKGTGGPFTFNGSWADLSTVDEPNPYRLASRGGKVGERWFDSEKSGMSAPRSKTFIERRPGHPDFGKRLRYPDELDDDTRDLVVNNLNFVSILDPTEDDSLDRRR